MCSMLYDVIVLHIISYFDGVVQDCSISSVLAMEILQSCTKPSILLDHFVKRFDQIHPLKKLLKLSHW